VKGIIGKQTKDKLKKAKKNDIIVVNDKFPE